MSARSLANFSLTASATQVLRETRPARAAQLASISANTSAGSRRLMRSVGLVVEVVESLFMAPQWRHKPK